MSLKQIEFFWSSTGAWAFCHEDKKAAYCGTDTIQHFHLTEECYDRLFEEIYPQGYKKEETFDFFEVFEVWGESFTYSFYGYDVQGPYLPRKKRKTGGRRRKRA